MTPFRGLVMSGLIGMAVSCATVQPSIVERGGQYIITVALTDRSAGAIPSDSNRGYLLDGEWRIPMSVRKQVRLLVADYDLEVIDAWPLVSIDEYCIVVGDLAEQLDTLSRDERVASVEPIHRFIAMRTVRRYNDTELRVQLGEDVQAMNRLHEWATGKGVRVGIIDTPIDIAHPDLKHRIKSEEVFLSSDPRPRDLVHGTAVAGIIGAEANNGVGIVGFAPDVEMRGYGACRFFDESSLTICNTFSLAKAIEAAAADDLDVLNLSLAGPYDALLERQLDRMIQRGTIVVAADDPDSVSVRFPAMMAHVIAATTLEDGRSLSPNRIRIEDEHLSTESGGGYRFFYGSSMSAARLTALISLLLEKSPGLSVTNARESLEQIIEGCNSPSVGSECAMKFALADRAKAFSLYQGKR